MGKGKGNKAQPSKSSDSNKRKENENASEDEENQQVKKTQQPDNMNTTGYFEQDPQAAAAAATNLSAAANLPELPTATAPGDNLYEFEKSALPLLVTHQEQKVTLPKFSVKAS